jgi:hypothetical protein
MAIRAAPENRPASSSTRESGGAAAARDAPCNGLVRRARRERLGGRLRERNAGVGRGGSNDVSAHLARVSD